MATISSRKSKKTGIIKYTAQIRLKIDGIEHTEAYTHAVLRQVEQWATLREAQLKQPGALAALKKPRVLVGDVLAWYLEDFQKTRSFGRSKLSTLKFLQKQDFLCGLDATSLRAADLISHAQARRATGTGPATVLNDFIWLTNAMRSVRLSRHIDMSLQAVEDAMKIMKKERIISKGEDRSRRPTLDELAKLMVWFGRGDGRAVIPMAEIMLFALFSSRRQEEITKLLWDDFEPSFGRIMVREMKHPVKKIDTPVYLTREAISIINRQPRVSDRIFPYDSKSISSTFTRACLILGIIDLHFHDLRHECISWLFELGNDIPRVAQHSGHRSWQSLQRYTHLQHNKPHNKYEHWEYTPSS